MYDLHFLVLMVSNYIGKRRFSTHRLFENRLGTMKQQRLFNLIVMRCEASRGWATQTAARIRFFFDSTVFVPGNEELGFAGEEYFMEKIVVNNFVCPAVCTEI